MRVYALILIGLLGGCSVIPVTNLATTKRLPLLAQMVLHKSTCFQLYSLDPNSGGLDSNEERLVDWKVVDCAKEVAAESRVELLDQFSQGVATNYGWSVEAFKPRHAIHVEHEQDVHDFVISFDCAKVHWYINKQLHEVLLVSKAPNRAFDDYMRSNHLEIGPRATHQ